MLVGSIPNLQRHIHIAPLAIDVVGIECFGISTLQDAAFATRFTIVQTLPGIKHISLSLFLD